MNRFCLLVVMGVLLVGVAAAETASVDFMPALFVQDLGTAHEVNNYTMNSDQDVTHGTWILLGTDDQIFYYSLDTRLFVDFSAGIQQQFNFTNAIAYRYYYLYLTGGFPVGSNLEVHFNYSIGGQTPAEQFTSPLNFTVKRGGRMVQAFDFSKNPPSGAIDNYSVMSSENLANSQTWYLYGANSLVIGDGLATPTLIDTQTNVGFTANVPKFFDISSAPVYNYYILYIQSGFYVNGMTIEVAFNSGVPIVPPIEGYILIGSTVGETWIEFNWNSTDSVAAYVDGRYYNTTSEDAIILNDLNPMEEHQLALYNITNLSSLRGKASATTHIPSTTVYTFSGIALSLLIVGIVFAGGWISTITSAFSSLSSAALGVFISGYWQVFSFALYGVAFVALMVLVWDFYSMGRNRFV